MTTIIHIIDELKIGGAQMQLLTMLRYAVLHDDSQHVVISLFGHGDIDGKLCEMGIEVINLDCRYDVRSHRFDRVVRELIRILHDIKPEIVEAHLTWSRILGLLAAAITRVPSRYGFEQGDIYLTSPTMRLLNFLSQLYIQHIIVCSEALKKWVVRTHSIHPQKLVVLHNCVDIDYFVQDTLPDSQLRLQALSHDGCFVIGMVGTLGQGVNKRVDIAIHALHKVRQTIDAHLVIIGDGCQRSKLELLCQQLNIADAVHFLGTRSDVATILSQCDLFCHAAPFEPFGIVALEAMAVGLPVIVPDSGGIAEIIEDGKSGLLYTALDQQALADCMLRLYTDFSLRAFLSQNALIRVQDFDVSVYMHRLYQLYAR